MVDWIKDFKEAKDQYLNGDMSRRDFLKTVSVICAAVGLTGSPIKRLTNAAWAAGKTIRFDGWGGVVQEAMRKYGFDPFTKATGIEVVEGEYGDEDTFLTRVKASFPPGGEYNVFHSSGLFDYARYINLGFGVVLDESKIPNLQYVMETMTKLYRNVSNGNLSAVSYDYGQTSIAYNTKYISKEKAEGMGVNLLWEKSLKGKLGNVNMWRDNIWYAALKSGQDPNNIQDIDTCWSLLREQQKLMKKYWSSGAELMSLLANEEIYAGLAWSGRVAALQQQGHPIELMIVPNGYSWEESLFVLKGSNLEFAQQLLNFMLEPECAIQVAIGINYPPTLDPSKVDMPEAIKKIPCYDPTGKLELFGWAEPAYWNAHQVEWAEKFDRIMSGA
jgi:spermidine/putrescine transport system substrate-binding protein